jgi:hypothetical protein
VGSDKEGENNRVGGVLGAKVRKTLREGEREL